MELGQLDVTTTILHGKLKEQIYIKHPKRFITPGKEGMVCLLKKKSLYDLK